MPECSQTRAGRGTRAMPAFRSDGGENGTVGF